MMKVSSNLQEVLKKSLPTAKQLQNRANGALAKLGETLVYEARKSMEEPKSGIEYYNPYIEQYYIASAPGEPLANYSGETSESITYVLAPNLLIFGGNTIQLAIWETADGPFERPTLKRAVEQYKGLFKTYYLNVNWEE